MFDKITTQVKQDKALIKACVCKESESSKVFLLGLYF